jgi:tetratricopeptide (TPR) repeat protein
VPRNKEDTDLEHDEKIENWCLEKLHVRKPDCLWNTQMALIISRHKNESDIRQRCLLALGEDEDDWRAMTFMANWMPDKRDAIKALQKVISRYDKVANPEDFAEMTWALGDAHWELGEFEDAKKWWSATIKHGPMKYSFLPKIITGYYSLKWWKEIVDVLKSLHSTSHLTPAMVAISKGPINEPIQKGILLAAVNTGELDLFDLVYPNAIKLAVKEGNYRASFDLRRAYASTLSAHFPPPTDRIIEILEAAAADVPYTNTDLAATFFRVGYRLGAIYLSKAREAQEAGKNAEAKQWLDRMSSVVPEQVTENQMRLPLSLFAARYKVVHGDRPGGKRLAHNTLRMAIELLADEDESNDQFAYMKILYAAIPFDDQKNAASALAMMKREAPNGKFRQYCSCPCNHKWTAPGEMYWCMDCINVVLTPKCRNVVKDEKSRSPICHHSHHHLYIPAWDEEKMSKVPDGEVPYDGKAISMDKWRKELSTKYHLN